MILGNYTITCFRIFSCPTRLITIFQLPVNREMWQSDVLVVVRIQSNVMEKKVQYATCKKE